MRIQLAFGIVITVSTPFNECCLRLISILPFRSSLLPNSNFECIVQQYGKCQKVWDVFSCKGESETRNTQSSNKRGEIYADCIGNENSPTNTIKKRKIPPALTRVLSTIVIHWISIVIILDYINQSKCPTTTARAWWIGTHLQNSQHNIWHFICGWTILIELTNWSDKIYETQRLSALPYLIV